MANDINFNNIPVHALRTNTRNALENLNCTKVIPSPNNLPRDWRGLEHLTGERVCRHDNPVDNILHAWEKSDTATFGQLQSFLAQLDRYDILDDTREMMCADAERYLRSTENSVNTLVVPKQDSESDRGILTDDDVRRLQRGMREPQYYDAFLLYTDDDFNFAMEIVDRLENGYQMKLCLKDRNLIGGLTFEHEAIMRLIAERCRRLVVVVSDSFLKSPANKFFVMFAQALGIEQRMRKVVPCLYTKTLSPISLPNELKYYFVLDYNRSCRLWNFWEKLKDSICSPAMLLDESYESHVVTVKEITDGHDCEPLDNNNHVEDNTSSSGSNHVMDVTSSEFSKIKLAPEEEKPKINVKKIKKKKLGFFKTKKKAVRQANDNVN